MNTVKKVQVEMLKETAQTNKVLDAVCHLFALRKRSRSTITVHGLKLAMTKQGFDYSAKEYGQALGILAKAGVGKLETSSRGNIKGISGIDITLQSLGKAVVGKNGDLKKNKSIPKKRFKDISSEIQSVHKQEFIGGTSPKGTAPIRKALPYPTFLTVLIEGRPVNFQGPSDITQDNLAEFLMNFKRVTAPEQDM